MQDRPTALELLQAIEEFLEGQVLAATDGTVKFLTRVSINSLRIVQRELQMEEDALGREWAGLNALLGDESRPLTLRELSDRVGERNTELSARIQSGDADSGDWADAVFEHVRQSVHDKAAIADPRLVS
ncbi:MAG TPA: DUF6285 domain-containing protein [Dehalococcoidia bacterium]|nr:DUF6285 domain-containing protein [Dehalococcoidia bacterium]